MFDPSTGGAGRNFTFARAVDPTKDKLFQQDKRLEPTPQDFDNINMLYSCIAPKPMHKKIVEYEPPKGGAKEECKKSPG